MSHTLTDAKHFLDQLHISLYLYFEAEMTVLNLDRVGKAQFANVSLEMDRMSKG